MEIKYQPIGLIHSPFKQAEGTPIQSTGAGGTRGRVDIFPEYREGLKDLEGFSHIQLLYHFHQTHSPQLIVIPFMDSTPRGVFATRAPTRPNAIGLSIVRLISIEENVLHIENVDIVDGTPLLDIKPYVPDFDDHPADRIGWLEKAKGLSKTKKADSRFGRRE